MDSTKSTDFARQIQSTPPALSSYETSERFVREALTSSLSKGGDGMPSTSRNASALAREAGYSAPYLYLLEEDTQPVGKALSQYSQRQLVRVSTAIRAGAGQGYGEHYQPWIRIRRNFSSPVSYQIFDSVSIHKRNHHFLSALEFHTALICAYLGAKGLRECLPMWPYEHPHPAQHLDQGQRTTRGLIEIAKHLGIDHGCFVGTTVPYVGSIDLMLNGAVGQKALAGISCKPRAITAKSVRAQERIELDRAYCHAVGAHHHHETGESIHPKFVENLRWLRPLASEVRLYKESRQLADYVASFNNYALERPIRDAVAEAARETSVVDRDPFRLWRLGIWLELIDIDLTVPVETTKMIRRASRDYLRNLRATFFGASNE